MKATEINYVAKSIFNEFKTLLKEHKEKYPKAIYHRCWLSVCRTKSPYLENRNWDGDGVSLSVCIGTNGWKDIRKEINQKNGNRVWHFTYEDRKAITSVIVEMLKELEKKKGWSGLRCEIADNIYQSKLAYGFISTITLPAEPCKEWNRLKTFISKYCSREIGDKEIWSVGIGGKRGYIYGEEGERYYLCNRSDLCEKYLNKLKSIRKAGDIIKTCMKREDDIDPWELKSSIMNEVEFSGSRNYYLEVLIKTKDGKLKEVIKIKC